MNTKYSEPAIAFRKSTYSRYAGLRDKRNMRDADVSKSTGISKSTISDWKNGKCIPKWDKMMCIAELFEMPIGVFISYLTNKGV